MIHCPYCHGYELRNRSLGVIATGAMSLHQAGVIPDWGVTSYFLQGKYQPDPEQKLFLQQRGVSFEDTPVVEVLGAGHMSKTTQSTLNTEDETSLSYWITIFGSEQDAIAVANVFYDTLNADLSALLIAAEHKDLNKCEALLHKIKGSIMVLKIDHLRIKIENCEESISNTKQINNSMFTLIRELLMLNRSVKVWLD
ncbi:Hpt domain-containing protein [Pseudoalteromonas sp. ZZD1]|uniref:Hpt domain-containing protein n=1 Tax=Pseudoalteromonas sp. ZZD1 TaxID=3139395 RepID=UPI003BAB0381